jgi:hypothetical protein
MIDDKVVLRGYVTDVEELKFILQPKIEMAATND